MKHGFERYCKDYENIENYEKAKADNFVGWDCHHRLQTWTSDGERRLVDITEAELKAKAEHELEDTDEAIVDFFQNNKTNLEVVKPILKEIKNLGYDKPQSISDLNDAKKILNLCK